MTVPAYLSLGSNVGDRKAHLDSAIVALGETPGVTLRGVSSYHQTAPAGGPAGQGAFLNATTAVETSLSPGKLLLALQAIEARAGRLREVRWGERTLDIDLLLFGDLILDEPGLTIPHPRMVVRRFVLAPLAEIAPGLIEPTSGQSIASLLRNLDLRPSYLALVGEPEVTAPLFIRLAAELSCAGLKSFPGQLPYREEPFTEPYPVFDNDRQWLNYLRQTSRELRGDRWGTAVWGDRWLITDFWFDLIYHDYIRGIDPEAWRDPRAERTFLGDFIDEWTNIIQPTFLVAIGPPGRQVRAGLADLSNAHPARSHLPILVPEAEDAEGLVSEIVVACKASRT